MTKNNQSKFRSVTTIANDIPHTTKSKAQLPKSSVPGVIEQATVIRCDAAGNPIVKQYDKEGNEIRAPQPKDTHHDLPLEQTARCPKHDSVPSIYKGKQVFISYPLSDCFLCEQEKHQQSSQSTSLEKPIAKPSSAVTMDSVRKFLGMEVPAPVLSRSFRTAGGLGSTVEEKLRHRQSEPPKLQRKRARRPDLSPLKNNLRMLEMLAITQAQLLEWLAIEAVLYDSAAASVKQPKQPKQKRNKRIKYERVFSDDDIQEMKATLTDLLDPSYDSGLTPQGVSGKIRKIRNDLRVHERALEAERRRKTPRVARPRAMQRLRSEDRVFSDHIIRDYRKVVEGHLQFDDYWRQFENHVIWRAVKAGVFTLTPEMRGQFPWFASEPRVTGRRDGVPDNEAAENALTLKTDGVSTSTSVISGGYGRHGRHRKLSTFEGSRFGITRGGSDPEGSKDQSSNCPEYDSSDDSTNNE